MQKQRPNRIALMLSDGEVADIQDFRFASRIGSQADAVRRLIKQGLAAIKKNGPAEAATSPDHDQHHTTQMENGNDA